MNISADGISVSILASIPAMLSVLPMMSRLGIVGRMSNGMSIDCDVTNGAFNLDVASPKCWALNADIRIARPGVLDELAEKLS